MNAEFKHGAAVSPDHMYIHNIVLNYLSTVRALRFGFECTIFYWLWGSLASAMYVKKGTHYEQWAIPYVTESVLFSQADLALK
jgi:hypothetical protein